MTGPALYRALLALFPPGFRAEWGTEADEDFQALWRDAGGGTARARLLARSLVAALGALVAEWWSVVTTARSPRGGPGDPRERRWSMDGWWRNVRYALRTLARSPAFAWSAVLLMALGIGAVTTIFTLVDHILLRPLPYPEPDRLVLVENGSHSGPLFRAMEDVGSVELWAGSTTRDTNLTGSGDPLRLEEARVTERFFQVFGARALRGRLFTDEDFVNGGVVALSERAWRTVWGSDPSLVGGTIQLDGRPATVVGVLEAGFSPPDAMVGSAIDVWRPTDWSAREFTEHEYSMLQVVGRLGAGQTPAAAQAEMDALMGRMAEVSQNYRTRDGEARALPVTPLGEVTVRGVRAGLGLLFGAVGLLLLVACANVAHLFLARGLSRAREMGVRRALGASTGSLVGQLLVESLVVGAAGGLVGLGLAWLGLGGFTALNPAALPRQQAVTLDLRVLGFTVLVSVATALLFGLLPAVRSVGRDVADELRGTGRGQTASRGVGALRNGLVVAEVGLSLVLVAGAGLLVRSFLGVHALNPGFQAENVWTLPLNPTGIDDPEVWVREMGSLEDALAAVPGVASATVGLTMPMEFTGGGRCCWQQGVTLEGQEEPQRISVHPVSETYFETLGIPLLTGRVWSRDEVGADPVPVVLSEPAATALFGGAGPAMNRTFESGERQVVVVGVAGDTRHYGPETEHGPAMYLPVEHLPFAIPKVHFAVRLDRRRASDATVRALREAVWSAAPGMPVPVVRSMEEWVGRATASRRFDSALFSSFAVLALLLAAGGLYGTLLYLAGQRRREIGIRLALGASESDIRRRILTGGLAVATLGVVAGLVGAWVSGRLLASRLWGVEAGDPLTLGSAAALLMLTAAVASWLPARRAGRVDPVETLRVE